MNSVISNYSTLVFDCDGVVLDSNRVKTEAFRQAALPYGSELADMLVVYHVANGGVSRYVKFRYFLDEIVPKGLVGPDLGEMLASYAAVVRTGLMECAVADGLYELRSAYPKQRWLIVSGGDQAELREIFAARKLDGLFDGGIFGSPDTKDMILEREIYLRNIVSPALLLGDSAYDWRAAQVAALDFAFVSDWTELRNWKEFVRENKLKKIGKIADLASLH
jgi:phosphoglycolate phosphatase-like HAD superfamily hydrolase